MLGCGMSWWRNLQSLKVIEKNKTRAACVTEGFALYEGSP